MPALAALLLAGCLPPLVPRDCESRLAYYPDADGDGLGERTAIYVGCEPPPGWVEVLEEEQTGTTGETGTTEETGDTAPPVDTSDTGDPPVDTGVPIDTSSPEDTGPPEDTAAPEDTGTPADTGA